MAFRIEKSACIVCGACEPVCPVDCISVEDDGKRLIDEDACIDCNACAEVCPVQCISEV